jgi:hypothetical protein
MNLCAPQKEGQLSDQLSDCQCLKNDPVPYSSSLLDAIGLAQIFKIDFNAMFLFHEFL